MRIFTSNLYRVLVPALLFITGDAMAQTDMDATMMVKNNLCTGLTYGSSSWKEYWEGTYRRQALNFGTVSARMYGLMANYGITDNLNVLAGLPYVQTEASSGTMHGQKGLQDLSLWVKWRGWEKKHNKSIYSVYLLAGGSVPVSNYVIDYLPLSLGSGSKTLSGRLTLDYQWKRWYATAVGTYTYRGNVTIDRTAYYTTHLVLSNQVQMPDVASANLQIGYRGDSWHVDAVVNSMNTLGGFDIRRNDMPFPSNRMDATTVGAEGKYDLPWVDGLSLVGGGNYVVAGRNVGQSTSFDFGIYYIIEFAKKNHSATPSTEKQQ
jgi:hypothetical protein